MHYMGTSSSITLDKNSIQDAQRYDSGEPLHSSSALMYSLHRPHLHTFRITCKD